MFLEINEYYAGIFGHDDLIMSQNMDLTLGQFYGLIMLIYYTTFDSDSVSVYYIKIWDRRNANLSATESLLYMHVGVKYRYRIIISDN